MMDIDERIKKLDEMIKELDQVMCTLLACSSGILLGVIALGVWALVR